MASPRADALGSGAVVSIGLFLVASNQRAALSGLPPLLGDIEGELGIGSTAAGLLTTIPTVTMGLLAPVVPRAAGRVGVDRMLVAGLALVAIGSIARLADPPLATLIIGGVLIGAGITTIGTLLPGVLRSRFPLTVGAMTGVTTFALATGAMVASALAVPFAEALGGWRAALAFWAVPATVALVFWLPQARIGTPSVRQAPPRMPVRSVTAWFVVAYMSLCTIGFFCCLAWVAPTFQDSGWSAASAGLALTALMAGNMLGAFGGPMLGQRMADRRPLLAGTACTGAVGVLGMAWLSGVDISGIGGVSALVPGAVPFIAGAGLGAAFALSLLMLAEVAAGPDASGGLSALTFLVAFLVASPFPLLLGYLDDVTGGFATGWVLVAALVVSAIATVPRLGPQRHGTVGVPVDGRTLPGN